MTKVNVESEWKSKKRARYTDPREEGGHGTRQSEIPLQIPLGGNTEQKSPVADSEKKETRGKSNDRTALTEQFTRLMRHTKCVGSQN